MSSNELLLNPIAVLHSCFSEKFGTPRQPNLVPAATGQIEMLPPYNNADAFDGLDEFSHLWLIFGFHQHTQHQWTPKVRPPRLGGNAKIGVFASRSSFRPNPLGLSVVKLEDMVVSRGKVLINISGQDMIDGTPIYDIKPYIRYSDSVPSANSAYAEKPPEAILEVQFSSSAQHTIQQLRQRAPHLEALIRQSVSLDPRPGYHEDNNQQRCYGMKILNFDVKFTVNNNNVIVEEISL